MKKLIIIFSLLGIGLVSYGQMAEKWADIDSTQTAKLSIGESESVDSIINFDDVSISPTSIIYDDTLKFNTINVLFRTDSIYATDKNWIWIYTLGK